MKRKILLVLMLAFISLSVNAQQCLSGGCSNFVNNYPAGTFSTTSSVWAYPDPAHYNMNAGNYTFFNVTNGNTYEWSYCESFGGLSTNWDPSISLYEYNNPPNAYFLCYSDDYCGTNGLAPYISWTATFTGTVLLLTSWSNNCLSNPNPPYNRLVWRRSNCTPVTVVNYPTDQTVTAPNSATFSVDVTGTSPAYQWQYSTNGGSTWNNVPNSSPYSGITSSDLVINPTSTSMSGYEYRCMVGGPCTSSWYTNWVTLTVNPSASPVISLSGNMNFGNVQVGNTSQQTLTITNTGNATLNVTSINYPQSVFTGSWSGNISAGNSHDVTVTFTPTSATSYGGTITVYSNATSGTNTISCSGTGTTAPAPAISLTGNMIFGNVQVGNSSQQTLTITNTGNATMSVSSIAYPTGFTGSWSGNISAGNSHNVTVTFTPSSAITYGGIITVNSNATSGINTISCSGTGTTISAPDLTITYSSVNITNLIPLASTQITYTISNIGNGVAGSSITSFFLSTNDVYNSGIDTWIKDDNVPSIAAFGNITHTVTVTIPINTSPSDWYIIIIVDAPDNVIEVTNANNTSFVSVTVNASISCTENTFPFGNGSEPCEVAGDPWGMIKYQCTSYTAWKVNEFFGETSTILTAEEYPFNNFMYGDWVPADYCNTVGDYYKLGHACHWAPILQYHGITVNNIPSVGSIAWWAGHSDPNINGAGEKGHVAYVSSVSGSVICITEYNWGTNYKCKFRNRTLDMSLPCAYGNWTPDEFIHIEVSGLGGDGITEMNVINKSFNIYPNPVSDFINIEIKNWAENKDLTFSLFNILGQLAYEERISSSLSTFSISSLPSGYYIYKIADKAGFESIGKIIKY